MFIPSLSSQVYESYGCATNDSLGRISEWLAIDDVTKHRSIMVGLTLVMVGLCCHILMFTVFAATLLSEALRASCELTSEFSHCETSPFDLTNRCHPVTTPLCHDDSSSDECHTPVSLALLTIANDFR